MCSGSEAGSYLRPTDFVYHSTLGLRVIKKKKKCTSLPGFEQVSVDGFIGVAFFWRKGSARALETAARAGLYLLIADMTV